MRFIGAIVGMIVGVMLVRGFFFDAAEEIGWRVFWHQFRNGGISGKDFQHVSDSATMAKTLLGAAFGLLAGVALGAKLEDSSRRALHSQRIDRQCPFCAETIKIQAVICRHCQRELPPFDPDREARIVEEVRAEKRRLRELSLAHLPPEERAYQLAPKGKCPQCSAVMLAWRKGCSECGATFGTGNAKLTPITDD